MKAAHRFLHKAATLGVAAFVCAAPLSHAQGPAAVQGRPPVEAFFQNRAFENAQLSPDGKHLALKIAPKDGRNQLMVMDVADPRTAKLVAGYADADIARYEWVNDKRLVYTVADRKSAQGDLRFAPGLYAVDRDGTEFRELVDRQATFIGGLGDRKLLPFTTQFIGPTQMRRGDDVFVAQVDYDPVRGHSYSLMKLDTRTGRTLNMPRPGRTIGFTLDGKDVPRYATTYEGEKSAVHYLDPADDKWKVLAEWNSHTAGGFSPLMEIAGELYVASHNGGDKEALYRFDVAKKALDAEPILRMTDYDYGFGASSFEVFNDRLVGVHYTSDAESVAWFDPRMKDLQAKVDAAFPGLVNRVTLPAHGELATALVYSYSDIDPGVYSLWDVKSGKATILGRVLPAIDPRQMAQRDLVRYKARDGLVIPAWLTLPKGANTGPNKSKPFPLVVLVHGGPWVRGGEWEWRADSQFLASRGYAVLEPEYRGSTGYGYKHFRAGFRQWGKAMQDDLADAANWAVSQGFAQAGRICIAGASYGGYATAMGLVNDPGIFKCGIDWAGVSDIDLMYSVTWGDFDLHYKTYGMPVMVADRDKDAEQIKATSPLEQAARIKQPLLLAHGGSDWRVPIVHGVKFRDAVQKGNPDVEWVEYKEEGHGWALVKNRVDWWARVEKFLQRNIGH